MRFTFVKQVLSPVANSYFLKSRGKFVISLRGCGDKMKKVAMNNNTLQLYPSLQCNYNKPIQDQGWQRVRSGSVSYGPEFRSISIEKTQIWIQIRIRGCRFQGPRSGSMDLADPSPIYFSCLTNFCFVLISR